MAERAQETGAVQLVAEQGGARVEARLDLLECDAELAALEELIRGAGQARRRANRGPPGHRQARPPPGGGDSGPRRGDAGARGPRARVGEEVFVRGRPPAVRA